MQFAARLASIRSTPSRSDDVSTVTRILFEAHDISVDALVRELGEDLVVDWARRGPTPTPLEEAIEASSTNGRVAAEQEVQVEPVGVAAAGGRRRGTRADPTEGE